MHKSSGEDLDVCIVFLDISKVFDKVWHDDIIFKLKPNGVSDKLLNLISNYLTFLRNRKQKVVLNGQATSWADVNTRVFQGFILVPLLFLIYINDPADNLLWNSKPLVCDTSLFFVAHNVNTSADELNNDLAKISKYA